MLVAQEPTKSLGKVKFGKPTNFSYCLENTGDRTIEINKLIVGCNSCTKAYTKKTSLKSGESTTIEVTFTPGSLGEQKKWITVRWNETQDLKLSFTADSYEH